MHRSKQSFNARARVGRALARVARMSHDGWAFDQAKEYARTGYIGPDLGAYLFWYWQGGDFPYVSLGSSRRADELFGKE